MSELAVIVELHACYQTESGMKLALTEHRKRRWVAWLAHGRRIGDEWGVRQLRGVIRWMKKGKRYPAAFRFRNLVELPDNFEEELELARTARSRTKGKKGEKQTVRVQTLEGVVERQLEPEEAMHATPDVEAPSEAVAEALRRFREGGLKISTAAELPNP